MEILLIVAGLLGWLALATKVSGFFFARQFPNLAKVYREERDGR